MLVAKYLQAFALISLLTSCAILVYSWPKIPYQQQTVQYESGATLILPDLNQSRLANALNVNAKREVELWLSDPAIFEHFLSRHKIFERIEKRVEKRPQLTNFVGSVEFRPFYFSDRRQTSLDEYDYAGSERRESRLRRRTSRPSHLMVKASGATPEDSQELARVAIDVIQTALSEVAVQISQNQQKNIQKYMSLNEKRRKKLTFGLDNSGFDFSEQLSLQSRKSQLQAAVFHQQQEIDRLQLRIKSGQPDINVLLPGDLVQRLESSQRQFVVASQIYMPDSPAFQLANTRLQQGMKIMDFFRNQATAKTASTLLNEIESKQRAIAVLKEQIAEIDSKIIPETHKIGVKSAIRQIEQIDTENNQWLKQLVKARLEEHVAKMDAATILLKEPQPGQRVWFRYRNLWSKFRPARRLLPIAPMLALILVTLYHILLEASMTTRRFEYYCATPVICEIPHLKPQYRPRPNRTPFEGSIPLKENSAI